jgi:hypothetical protein
MSGRTIRHEYTSGHSENSSARVSPWSSDTAIRAGYLHRPHTVRPRTPRVAIGLVRTINTAEVVERSTYGSFASWQTLLAHEQKKFNEWFASFYSHDPNVHFGSTPEILPGWNLRLLVQPDGLGYVVLVEDATDKNGYAALSDERGVIRVCKPLQ